MNIGVHWYLICYDIRNVRRLSRTHRYLRRQALMLQESVYLYAGNTKAAALLRAELKKRINPHQDDVRIYQLAANAELQFYAQPPWGHDIVLTGLPACRVLPSLAEAAKD